MNCAVYNTHNCSSWIFITIWRNCLDITTFLFQKKNGFWMRNFMRMSRNERKSSGHTWRYSGGDTLPRDIGQGDHPHHHCHCQDTFPPEEEQVEARWPQCRVSHVTRHTWHRVTRERNTLRSDTGKMDKQDQTDGDSREKIITITTNRICEEGLA